MVISLGWLSPATSCGLPAAQTTRAGSRCLLGLAPTGGCRAAPVARRAVGSYPTFSPLPFGEKGGLFSVALSVALRRPGVTWQSDRKSTRLNSSHLVISYAVFCLKKKNSIKTSTVIRSVPPIQKCFILASICFGRFTLG